MPQTRNLSISAVPNNPALRNNLANMEFGGANHDFAHAQDHREFTGSRNDTRSSKAPFDDFRFPQHGANDHDRCEMLAPPSMLHDLHGSPSGPQRMRPPTPHYNGRASQDEFDHFDNFDGPDDNEYDHDDQELVPPMPLPRRHGRALVIPSAKGSISSHRKPIPCSPTEDDFGYQQSHQPSSMSLAVTTPDNARYNPDRKYAYEPARPSMGVTRSEASVPKSALARRRRSNSLNGSFPTTPGLRTQHNRDYREDSVMGDRYTSTLRADDHFLPPTRQENAELGYALTSSREFVPNHYPIPNGIQPYPMAGVTGSPYPYALGRTPDFQSLQLGPSNRDQIQQFNSMIPMLNAARQQHRVNADTAEQALLALQLELSMPGAPIPSNPQFEWECQNFYQKTHEVYQQVLQGKTSCPPQALAALSLSLQGVQTDLMKRRRVGEVHAEVARWTMVRDEAERQERLATRELDVARRQWKRLERGEVNPIGLINFM